MTSPKAVITGASGFIGRALAARLADASFLHFGVADWRQQLAGARLEGATVFHLAARVHGTSRASIEEYRADNVAKTEALAKAARDAGARRLVFLSTIKVNGEETGERAFTASDKPHPEDDYARSKWEAEELLRAMKGLEVSIVRSPLVYGPGAGANLRSLVGLADTPWPLPFASLDNRRSFVHVDDLADLLMQCATHEAASNATFVAAHAEAVSTARVVAEMRKCLGRSARLFSMSGDVLEAMAALGGARDKMRRLTRNLEIDAAETTRRLGWTARVGIEEAIAGMVRAYREATR